MQRVLNHWSGKAFAAMLCLAAVAATTDARIVYTRLTISSVLPGVDSGGNLDNGSLFDASVKATINTREERVYAQLRGQVSNESGQSFYAEDSFIGNVLLGYTAVSDIYKVSRRGSAYGIVRAYIIAAST